MNPLGDTIRTLMRKQGLTGVQLSAEIGLSETSLSRILKGHSRPKQVTLTRLMKRLCENEEDSQKLLRSFAGVADAAEEEPVSDDPKNTAVERERVERWLEARTQAITFKDAVARELDKAGLPYRRDACDGIASTDFLIERDGKRIALECKFNVSRDFDKTLGIARLLCDLLRCDQVIIVVPFVGAFADAASSGPHAVTVCTPAEAARILEGGVAA